MCDTNIRCFLEEKSWVPPLSIVKHGFHVCYPVNISTPIVAPGNITGTGYKWRQWSMDDYEDVSIHLRAMTAAHSPDSYWNTVKRTSAVATGYRLLGTQRGHRTIKFTVKDQILLSYFYGYWIDFFSYLNLTNSKYTYIFVFESALCILWLWNVHIIYLHSSVDTKVRDIFINRHQTLYCYWEVY